MKRYWLFRGNSFYPHGGMEDLFDSSDDLEDVKFHLEDMELYEWAHIWDMEEMKIMLKANISEDNEFIWEKPE